MVKIERILHSMAAAFEMSRQRVQSIMSMNTQMWTTTFWMAMRAAKTMILIFSALTKIKVRRKKYPLDRNRKRNKLHSCFLIFVKDVKIGHLESNS